ncbi:hypothetical protein [Sphingobium yanoikuyae]|nr:hypothetical protein [Sphingobium yanoikuyae]
MLAGMISVSSVTNATIASASSPDHGRRSSSPVVIDGFTVSLEI